MTDDDRPSTPPPESPASDARRPNVVVVILDDLGFADIGCFGASIETPNIDRLAAEGLRYNRFHVTAVCSPTRASLLTGRNHHAVGMGGLPDEVEEDGYSGRIPDGIELLPAALGRVGYRTLAAGKWHITPHSQCGPDGPYDRWPLAMGFDEYYGFLTGFTDQWRPRDLVRGTTFVDPPRTPEEGYHLTEDLADEAIRMIRDTRAGGETPFFLYFAPGATHWPHHAPAEWIAKYRGAFDHGWDEDRARRFERQLDSGVVPEGTVLTERPTWAPGWDELDDTERRVFARQMEVFAAFVSHTDAQIGRVVDAIEALGELDDTIVLFLTDNGPEGGLFPEGLFHFAGEEEGRMRLGMEGPRLFPREYIDYLETRMDDFGGPESYGHYHRGWAWAGAAPFRFWKCHTWLGGVRVPLIARWPGGIPADQAGSVRSQFVHVIDLAPTIAEAAGAEFRVPDGNPIQGASGLATFSDPAAPDPRSSQYFEMFGSRSIYRDGWKATTDHQPGRDIHPAHPGGSLDFATDRWELHDLGADFSEARDLSGARPELLAELVELWDREALANSVYPLADVVGRPGIPNRSKETHGYR